MQPHHSIIFAFFFAMSAPCPSPRPSDISASNQHGNFHSDSDPESGQQTTINTHYELHGRLPLFPSYLTASNFSQLSNHYALVALPLTGHTTYGYFLNKTWFIPRAILYAALFNRNLFEPTQATTIRTICSSALGAIITLTLLSPADKATQRAFSHDGCNNLIPITLRTLAFLAHAIFQNGNELIERMIDRPQKALQACDAHMLEELLALARIITPLMPTQTDGTPSPITFLAQDDIE